MPIRVPEGEGKEIPRVTPQRADVLLPIQYREQIMSNWCWAACCEMIFLYSGINNVTQGEIVSFELKKNCLLDQDSLPDYCNQNCWPTKSYKNWRIQYNLVDRALKLNELQIELNSKQPVQALILQGNLNSHVVILIGYYSNGDVCYHDPWDGGSIVCQYEHLLSGFDLGTKWALTFKFLI